MEDTESLARINHFKEALRSLTGESANLPNRIKQFMLENQAHFLDWVNAEISYSGFNAVAMRKKVALKIKTEEYLFILLSVAIIRGNNLTNILKSMKGADSKKIVTECKASLKIVDRVGGDVGAVTLSRILACFPDIITYQGSKLKLKAKAITPYILQSQNVPMVVPIETLKSISPHFPCIARHQTIAGLIPDTVSATDLIKILNVFMVPYMLTSKIINQKNKEWAKLNLKTQFETNAKYLLNSLHSKVIPETKKVQLSEDLDIVKSGVPGAAWESSFRDCKTWLEKDYGIDMSSIIVADNN